MFKISSNRVYGYFDDDNLTFMKNTKDHLIKEKYNKSSLSKIMLLGVIELKENNSYNDIKEKLITREMI